MFRVGESLLAREDQCNWKTELTLGKIYTVTKVHSTGKAVNVEGCGDWWWYNKYFTRITGRGPFLISI
tara:strand:- start:1912 stop:2115 length:204 start_codon:yes stop_codon:yes gene_type:complete